MEESRVARELIPQKHIDLMMRFHMYCAKINSPIGRSYRRLLTALGGASSTPPDGTWDWRKLPAKLSGSVALNSIFTAWMCYALIRVLLFDQLSNLLGTFSVPYLDMPGSCLLLGRLVLHPKLESAVVGGFCGFHLIWRSVQYFADHNFRLTALQFLFHSERDLERFYALLAAESAGSELVQQAAPTSDYLVQTLEEVRLELPDRQPDINEQLLRHTMCYLVHNSEGQRFRLRPNRSLEARRKLAQQLMRSFVVASAFMLICILTVGSYAAMMVFSDSRYAEVYAGCSKRFDEMYAQNRLPAYGLALLPDGHRLLALLADATENIIIWVDSGLAVTFVTTFGYLLNYDIISYWSSLHAKLESCLQMARERHSMAIHSGWPGTNLRWAMEEQFNKPQVPLLRRSSSDGFIRRSEIEQLDHELELGIQELQFEIFDFFNEVKRVDLFVGDLLTLSLLVWLSSWLLVCFYSLSGSMSSMTAVMILSEVIGLCVIITASYLLLELRRSCLRSYPSLCSLMALDKSKHKPHFIKIIEFFTQLNRTTYWIAHNYPYKPTTFISIMGWFVSSFILTLTLFNPRVSPPSAGPSQGNSSLARHL